jgi:hypothetical protein
VSYRPDVPGFGLIALVAAVVSAAMLLTVLPTVTAQGQGLDAAPGDTTVRVAVDAPGVPPGTPLRVGFGPDDDRHPAVEDGDRADVRGTDGAVGLLTARDDAGEVVAMAVVPKDPLLVRDRTALDARSTALAILMLTPGWTSTDPYTAALVEGAASSTEELDAFAAQLERRAEAGGAVLELDEDDDAALAALAAATDARLRSVLLADGAADLSTDDADAADTGAGGGGLASGQDLAPLPVAATRPLTATAVTAPPATAIAATATATVATGSSGRATLARSDRPSMDPSCDGDGVFDLDGLEGDGFCLRRTDRTTHDDRIVLEATNRTPRWAVLYRDDRTGVSPDGVVAPRRWDIPSVGEILYEVGRAGLQPFIDRALELLGGAGVRVEDRTTFAERIQALIDEWSEDEVSLLAVEPRDDGLRLVSAIANLPRRELGEHDRRRVLATSLLTVGTEVVVPVTAIVLDLRADRRTRGLEADLAAGSNVAEELQLTRARAALAESTFLLLDVLEHLPTLTLDEDERGAALQELVFDLLGVMVGAYTESLALEALVAFVGDALAAEGFSLDVSGGMAAVSGVLVSEFIQKQLARLAGGHLSVALEVIEAAPEIANTTLGLWGMFESSGRLDAVDAYEVVGTGEDDLLGPGSPGANVVVLVVDVSGSMSDTPPDPGVSGTAGTKLDAAKDAMSSLVAVGELDVAQQATGLVTFAAGSDIVLGIDGDPARARSAIRSLSAGGGTDLGSGLESALDLLRSARGDKRVVLLSDGATNAGLGHEAIIDQLGGRAVRDSVVIDTVGFAYPDTLDEELLRELAALTGGSTQVVQSRHDLRRSFVRSRHDSTGEVVADVTGQLDGSQSNIAEIEVEGTPSALVVSLLSDADVDDVALIDPLGRVVDGATPQVQVRAGDPASIQVARPTPGTWTVVLPELAEGDELVDLTDWRPPGAVTGSGQAPSRVADPAGAGDADASDPLSTSDQAGSAPGGDAGGAGSDPGSRDDDAGADPGRGDVDGGAAPGRGNDDAAAPGREDDEPGSSSPATAGRALVQGSGPAYAVIASTRGSLVAGEPVTPSDRVVWSGALAVGLVLGALALLGTRSVRRRRPDCWSCGATPASGAPADGPSVCGSCGAVVSGDASDVVVQAIAGVVVAAVVTGAFGWGLARSVTADGANAPTLQGAGDATGPLDGRDDRG